MKLSTWAKANDMTYQSAWNLFKKGNLPVMAVQLNNGTILVEEDMFKGKSRSELIAYFCQMSSLICKNLYGDGGQERANQIQAIINND